MKFTGNLTLLQYIKKHHIQLKKQFGQNFLIDENALLAIAKAGAVEASDHIIEVGPGLGPLSLILEPECEHLTMVEKDSDLIPHLEELFKESKKVTILNEDVLEFHIPEHPYKVIANIPYYITSPIILKFLRSNNPPSRMVLLMQKEVADKICTVGKGCTVLSVLTQAFAKPTIIREVSRTCFIPAPRVTSSILLLEPHDSPRITSDFEMFAKVTKAGFLHKRKKLKSNIAATFHLTKEQGVELLKKADIDEDIRAERVTIEQWDALTKLIAAF